MAVRESDAMKRKLDVDLEPGEASTLEWMAGVVSTRDLELLVARHNVEASRVPELMSALVKVHQKVAAGIGGRGSSSG